MKNFFLFGICVFTALLASVISYAPPVSADSTALTDFDNKVNELALSCSQEVLSLFNTYLASGTLTLPQLFDTFYIPVPGTDPPEYHTQYDKIVEEPLQTIIDRYLSYHKNIIYVIAVDAYGYLPAYNSKYSHSFTGNRGEDFKNNRAKRILNDHIGLSASRNQTPSILQKAVLDTGEIIKDFSVPLFVKDRHWGAVRIGYTINN